MVHLRVKGLAAVLAAMVIAACGGSGSPVGSGGGGGGGGGTQATAAIALPPGVLPAGSTVTTIQSEAVVTAAPQKLTVNAGTPTLAVVTETASGKLLSLGYVKPVASTQTLDHKSAAAALIFTALGGANEQGANRTDLLDQIVAAAATTTLANVISAQWAGNPYALDNPDAALKAAVLDAVRQVSGSVRRPDRPRGESDRLPDEFATGLDVSLNLVRGDGKIFGTLVDTGQYAIRNLTTLPATAFQYTLLHNEVPVDPVAPYGTKITVPYLGQPLNGGLGWVQTAAILPQLQGNDDLTGYFNIILIPVFGKPDPADFADPYWAPELPKWRAELASLRQKALLRVFAEIVLDFVGAGGSGFTLGELEQTLPLLDASGPDVHSQLENAKREDALISTLGQLLLVSSQGDDVARKVLLSLKPVAGANAGFLDPANLSVGKVKAFRAALRVYATLGIIEPLGSYGPKLQELQTGPKMALLDVRVSRGSLHLEPNIGEYGPGDSIAVRANVRNFDASDDVSFRWTLEIASHTTMSSGDGKTGFVIDTPSDRVTLRTTSASRGSIKLKCELFAKNDQGVKGKVGEAYSNFAQVGDLTIAFDSWPRSPGTTIFYAYSVIEKRQVGRNRYEGGNYHVELYRGSTLKARYDFRLPEYVGLKSGLTTDPGTNDRKLTDPGKFVLDEGVDVYDHGDKLFLVVAKGLWADDAPQSEIDQTKLTVVNGRAGTTLLGWRTGP